jgi:hypothetical protein
MTGAPATVATSFAVTVVALVLIIATTHKATEAPAELPASKWDEHMLKLDRQALDGAYVGQMQKLFGVWMSDSHDQPQRAIVGANKARAAYIGVMTEIERREAKQ